MKTLNAVEINKLKPHPVTGEVTTEKGRDLLLQGLLKRDRVK